MESEGDLDMPLTANFSYCDQIENGGHFAGIFKLIVYKNIIFRIRSCDVPFLWQR